MLQGGLFLVWGLYLLGGAFWNLRRRLRIKSIPRSKIAAAAVGPIELHGFGVRAVNDMVSPGTQTPCIYYRYKILKRRKTRRSSEWKTIYSEDSSHIPFLVKDETGEVWVYPLGCELYSNDKMVIHGGQYTIEARDALLRMGKTVWAMMPDDHRIEEELLLPNSSIYVLGYLHVTQDFLRQEITGEIHDHIVRLKERSDILKVIDKNKDGRLDQAEWDAARERLESAIKENYREARGSKVVGFKKNNFFILSSYREGSLTGQFGFFAILKLFGGLVLTVGASAYLLSQL